MTTCENCKVVFKHNWHLQRHLRRKRPCGSCGINAQNNTEFPSNESIVPSNESRNVCKYCEEIFSRNDSLQRHLKTCKEKYDTVRCLEIQLGIKMNKAEIANECKFCNKVLSPKSSLMRHLKTCRKKHEYKEYLEEKLRSNEKNSKKGHIYVARLREHENSNEQIYKIGMTQQGVNKQNGKMKRLSGYPKGTKVYELLEVDNCRCVEDDIIRKLKELTTQRTDLGHEYFEGELYKVLFVTRIICGYDT
jgi:hypothetical protein